MNITSFNTMLAKLDLSTLIEGGLRKETRRAGMYGHGQAKEEVVSVSITTHPTDIASFNGCWTAGPQHAQRRDWGLAE